MRMWRALAPAKINLGLFIGPLRDDGRHELVSVMQSISLADELVLEERADAAGDVVECPGVEGENLAAAALHAFRAATGWDGPPWRLSIVKRVPVAAGLGGGSGDAAAALRLASAASGRGDPELLLALGAQLGADVPAQVRPGRVLATGAGERIERLPDPETFGVLVLPTEEGLSTAAVYGEADRLGIGRDRAELQRLEHELRSLAAKPGASAPAPLLVNDLEAAALSLRPELADTLAQARAAGADAALVSGSGPTVLGLFAGSEGVERARAAARTRPAAIAAQPVDASGALAAVVPVRHNGGRI
jgi:4-diphosphocytidyl-2-C-methyl-D-erythritol kinase